VVVVDCEQRAVTRTLDGALAVPPLLVDDALLFAADGKLMLQVLGAEGEAKKWMTTSWLGDLTTPVLLRDANAYLGTTKYGLVRAGKWK